MKFEWEIIDRHNRIDSHSTYRARVKGGWLVRCGDYDSISLIFVPDEHHTWKVEE